MKTKPLNIGAIVLDERLQSRAEIDEEAVSEYADNIEAGDEFPPVLVFFDGVHYYLTDGYHRYHAHKRAGRASISCEVVNGTLRDAIFHSTSVNSKHGMRRTNADKRKAVATLLDDFEWCNGMSDAQIAEHCSVSTPFVANIRAAMGKSNKETVKYHTPTGKLAEKKKAPGRPKKEIPEPPPAVEKEEHTQEAIDVLLGENEQLKDRLAVAAMDATDEEKDMARQTIVELREELRLAKIELTAVKSSRDTFQAENQQLKAQVKMLNNKLKKAGVE